VVSSPRLNYRSEKSRMATATTRFFGVKEYSHVTTEADLSAEEIRILGYSVLSDILSGDELAQIRRRVDEAYDQQAKEMGGESELRRMGDAHTARCLLAYDDCFVDLATKERTLDVVRVLLGDYFILMMQNGVINVPVVGSEHNAGAWHRDLNYQHFVSTRPLSISALYCVDDFTVETGATEVLPGTHRIEPCPSSEFTEKNARTVEASAGSVIIFDSMMYHRGGENVSNRVRRGINHMYTLPLIKQQISFPRLRGDRFEDNPPLRRLLGYDSETADSLFEWRKARLDRAPRS